MGPACSEVIDDYTLGTFTCQLTVLPGGPSFDLGNVVIASVGDAVENFPSHDYSPSVDERNYGQFRKELIVRVATDTINYRNLRYAYDCSEVAVAGGYRLDFETFMTKTNFQVQLDHYTAVYGGRIMLFLHRCAVGNAVDIPWSPDTLTSMELEFHAQYCPDKAQPFGYWQVTGVFATI